MSGLRCLVGAVGILMLCGCGSIPRVSSVPPPIADINVEGFESAQIRFIPFEGTQRYQARIEAAFQNETPDNYDIGPDGQHIYSYLALSGGGSDGAFGAGILNGWTETGTRPRFKVVTGVSTGALMAPFAFLGPDYDDELKASYTKVNTQSIFIVRGLLSILWSESVTSTEPLQNLIKGFVDEKLLDAVAAEHKKGRRLYVASTNLDAETPVIWDMGEIASSNRPNRLDLFRKALLASASIPSVFPPVMFDVWKDGTHHQELHVDGGVFFQSFSIGAAVDLPSLIRAAHPDFSGNVEQNLYIIRNSWVTPSFQQVERGLAKIAGRSVLSMFKVSGINDLWRLYLTARDDKVNYHYIAIPADYVPSTTEQFNETEMNREFDFGRKMALQGIPWKTLPPGYVGAGEASTE